MRRDVFQAVADPTRRAILVSLRTEVKTPNSIAEQFNITRQAVSKHLKVLNECKLLRQEQQGREIYYRLNPDELQKLDIWLEQFRQMWEMRFSKLDEILTTVTKEKK